MRFEQLPELLALARKVRATQRLYFETRKPAVMRESITLERELDQQLERIRPSWVEHFGRQLADLSDEMERVAARMRSIEQDRPATNLAGSQIIQIARVEQLAGQLRGLLVGTGEPERIDGAE